jgi:hypothetical protein
MTEPTCTIGVCPDEKEFLNSMRRYPAESMKTIMKRVVSIAFPATEARLEELELLERMKIHLKLYDERFKTNSSDMIYEIDMMITKLDIRKKREGIPLRERKFDEQIAKWLQ